MTTETFDSSPSAPEPYAEIRGVLALADAHGLALDPASVRLEEMGLDFQVAFGRTADGLDWVLRIPRRADVLARAEIEGRLLDAVRPHLPVAVPHWRIRTTELIAYPLLPGVPGLTVRGDGEVSWAIDPSSLRYARSLGTVVAQLHSVDAADVVGTGIEKRDPREVREAWRDDLLRVAAEFAIAPTLRARWDAWIAEDSYWPTHSVLTHGEIYPAHTLVEDEQISAILDWTTASLGDPARDFVFHRASASDEAFDAALDAYRAAGGRTWPRLGEHCVEMFSATPVGYGIFALSTGQAEHQAAAAAALDPHP